jgi:hypothetical protein
MMNPTREQVAVGLFTLLGSIPGIKSSSRRPALWDDATAKPALYMGNPAETYVYQNGTATPPIVILDFDVFLYIDTGMDPNSTPDTAINNLLDAIEAAITPPVGQAQTLGGVVNHAWIEGSVHRVPGYLNGQGMVLFTVKTLVPQ